MNAEPDNRAAAKAAVISYAAGHGDITKAVRRAYESGDWDGIQDGLDHLAKSGFQANRPAVASLKAIVSRMGKDESGANRPDAKTISMKDGAFTITAPKGERDGAARLSPKAARKAVATLVAQIRLAQALEESGTCEGAAAYAGEIVAAVYEHREMAEFKVARESTVTAVERLA